MTETAAKSHDQMAKMLDILCPMHLLVSATGHVTHVGPTLAKLRPVSLVGARFLEVFEVLKPRRITSISDLVAREGEALRLRFRDLPGTRFKAVLAEGGGPTIINFAFAGPMTEAVAAHNLNLGDFAPTDITVEMLYLAEANSAANAESRKLIIRLQGAKIAAEEQAFTDTLTGLKNRRALDMVLARKMAQGEHFACMKVDLDYFKSINDTQGHAAGDHVLQVAAGALVSETRVDDIVARVGGDEFVILLSQLDAGEALDLIAVRIIHRLEKPISYNGEICRISGSLGTAMSGHYRADQMELMLDHADRALYASKKAGRGCHTLFTTELLSQDLSIGPEGERGAAHPEAKRAG